MTLLILGFERSNFVRTVLKVAEENDVAYELLPKFPHLAAAKLLTPTGKPPGMCTRNRLRTAQPSHLSC